MTRSSYDVAVVTEGEHTAAASVTFVPRSLASSLRPALARAMFGGTFLAGPFIICGALKITYDLLLGPSQANPNVATARAR